MSFERALDVVLGYLWFTVGVLTVSAVVLAVISLVWAVVHGYI